MKAFLCEYFERDMYTFLFEYMPQVEFIDTICSALLESATLFSKIVIFSLPATYMNSIYFIFSWSLNLSCDFWSLRTESYSWCCHSIWHTRDASCWGNKGLGFCFNGPLFPISYWSAFVIGKQLVTHVGLLFPVCWSQGLLPSNCNSSQVL